jgi:Uma2 family endonuclease
MPPRYPQIMSIEEYVQLEEDDIQHRYECVDGSAYMMADVTVHHDTIKSNIQRLLCRLLRGQKCRPYSSDIRVRVSETCYYHPDVTKSCDGSWTTLSLHVVAEPLQAASTSNTFSG